MKNNWKIDGDTKNDLSLISDEAAPVKPFTSLRLLRR